MSLTNFFAAKRAQFPALARTQNGQPVVYLDGPAGTQVPQAVIDAIGNYLSVCNANHGGAFPTSGESDAILAATMTACGSLLGIGETDSAMDPPIIFGANMTSLTFAFSRALARTWQAGDEIILTRLDHDANVTPWTMAAADNGVTVKWIDIHPEDGTLDMDSFHAALSDRTRLVAVGAASNATGGVNPITEITRQAHDAGAEVFVDAVHYVPHFLPDVTEWDCDYLVCSAYKFFGPHVGIMWGRPERLAEIAAYKVRPASNVVPWKWMTGTQNHECIAGVLAAIDYLISLGAALQVDGGNVSQPLSPADQRQHLSWTYEAIRSYEESLSMQFLEGLFALPNWKVHGISEVARFEERFPTFSITHNRISPAEAAARLAAAGIFAWHGNYYALQYSERMNLEPNGMLRLGFVHYNTAEEVDRLLTALAELG